MRASTTPALVTPRLGAPSERDGMRSPHRCRPGRRCSPWTGQPSRPGRNSSGAGQGARRTWPASRAAEHVGLAAPVAARAAADLVTGAGRRSGLRPPGVRGTGRAAPGARSSQHARGARAARVRAGRGAVRTHDLWCGGPTCPSGTPRRRVAAGDGANLARPRPVPRELRSASSTSTGRSPTGTATPSPRPRPAGSTSRTRRRPPALDGAAFRAHLAALAPRPFRTRPNFNTTPWGGHWASSDSASTRPPTPRSATS